jgi:HEAT repeat protein
MFLGPSAKPLAPALVHSLENLETDVTDTVIALRRVDPESWRLLLPLLKHPESFWRSVACASIGEYGARAKDAVPLLRESLKFPDSRVRHLAAEALKSIDSDASGKQK